MTTLTPELRVPPLYCPAADAIHPRAELLNERTVAWMTRFQLYADDAQRCRLVSMRPGMGVARVLPRGLDDPMQPVTDFHTWLFALDDAYCDEGALGRRPGDLAALLAGLLRVAEVPSTPMLRDNPYAEALRDIRLRLAAYATEVQLGRWVRALRTYFLYQVWEAANRAHTVIPSLNDYTILRLHSGGLITSTMLLDIGDGYELPTAQMQMREVQALIEMTSIVVGWDNDLFSYSKESRRTKDGQNLLDVIAHEYGCSPQRALTRAVSFRDRIMSQFIRVRGQLLPDASPELARYLGSLTSWIHANLEFSRTCDRYVDAGLNPADLPPACTAEPSDTNPDPLPIPSIAWWWTCVRDSGMSSPNLRGLH